MRLKMKTLTHSWVSKNPIGDEKWYLFDRLYINDQNQLPLKRLK